MNFDEKGVRFLAMMVIRQAFEDYVEAGRKMAAIKDPFRNDNTLSKYNAIFNKLYSERFGDGIGKYNADEVYAYIEKFIERRYYRYARFYIETAEFFDSERFLIFSRNIDGKWCRKKGEEYITDWLNGGAYSRKLKMDL